LISVGSLASLVVFVVYTVAVQRFSLAVCVALLTLSASGIPIIAIGEPCAGFERETTQDGSCPPTCVTCGCCAQGVEPVVLFVSSSPKPHVADLIPLVPRLPKSLPDDILHVPKSRVA
jgi:hypothetical protein